MTACDACLRRTHLLARLAGHLDHLHARRGLLDEVFALADEELVAALVSSPRERRCLLRPTQPGEGDLSAVTPGGAGRPGLRPVCRHAPGYPRPLLDLQGPPAVLFTTSCERLADLGEQPAAAIVGARRASAYGLEVARALGRDLARARVTVVSGMALGVDSAAHAGVLEAGGRTVAVLAGGADVPYPASKRALYRALVEHGAVISEMPPGFAPRRWAFPARNRTIAGLAAITVVVEATERSGALITARIARELGRDVAGVPGRITSPVAAGVNALLRDGALLVDGPAPVLDAIFGVGVRRVPARGDDELAPALRRLLEAVRNGHDTVAALAAGEGAAAGIVAALGAGEGEAAGIVAALGAGEGEVAGIVAALGELELAGYVRRGAGGVYVPLA